MSTENAEQEQHSREREIAATIIEQCGIVPLALGFRRPLALNEGGMIRGGLQVHVGRGQWALRIVLTGRDLYDVEFVTRRSGRVGYDVSDVYCDQLQSVLFDGADHVRI